MILQNEGPSVHKLGIEPRADPDESSVAMEKKCCFVGVSLIKGSFKAKTGKNQVCKAISTSLKLRGLTHQRKRFRA